MERVWIAGVLAMLASFAGAADKAPTGSFNLLIEGELPGSAALRVTVVGYEKKKTVEWLLPLSSGKVLVGLALPAGTSRKVTLRAEDARGKSLFAGEALIEGSDQFATLVELESTVDGPPAEVTLASHRIAIEFATVERKGTRYTRATANVFDANGKRLDLKAGELDWEIGDPGFRERLIRCPESRGVSMCAEFLPLKPDELVTMLACYRGGVCRFKPVPPRPPVWRKIVLSQDANSCALKLDGQAYCWGMDDNGQTGYIAPKICNSLGGPSNTNACSLVPQLVQCAGGPCNFIDIAAGDSHTCAIDANQYAWCWGDNFYGALGLGYFDAWDNVNATPTRVAINHKFLQIHAGRDATCGLTTDREVWCWGSNFMGVIPHLASMKTHTPERALVPEPVESMDFSTSHPCARTATGSLYCWGLNVHDRLGSDPFPTNPICGYCPSVPQLMQERVPELQQEPVSLVSEGWHGTCAHTITARTPCWGAVIPPFPSGVPLDRLSRGYDHYCAIADGGELYCAGRGALGDGMGPVFLTDFGPVGVSGPPDSFREVDTGIRSTCGIGNDEKVYCWGASVFGLLGLGVHEQLVTRPAKLAFP